MAFLTRLTLPLLLLAACGPKDALDDAGDETTGASTTGGDDATTGASDPTNPGTASGTATAGSASGGSASGGTTVGTSTSATTGADDTSTSTTTNGSTATATSTTGATDTETGDPPPIVPCEGEGTPLEAFPTTMAYLQSQVPPPPNPSGTGGSGTTDGGGLDPGTVLVKLSNQSFTCADPEAALTCGKQWEVTIVIPPEFQSPGVFNLLGPDVRGVAAETGAAQGADCSFGGGSFDATFQILAIDETGVQGRLCNVADSFFESDPQLEGTFSAPRCP